MSPDLTRESDLALSRSISEDVLRDQEVITEVRERVESSRIMFEVYGGRMSSHDFVTHTLEYLAEVLRERHHA